MSKQLLNNIPLDIDGYLIHLNDWNIDVASELALQENITLDERHWEIIKLLQEFYQEFEIAPSMRALVKYVAAQTTPDKGNSIYLLTLFPPSPARIGCKIAGLPRPANCL